MSSDLSLLEETHLADSSQGKTWEKEWGKCCPAAFPFVIFLLCCLTPMARTRTVVVDLRDFPPNFERKDIAKTFYASMGRIIPLTQSKLFLVGFVRSPSHLVSPKFLYAVRNLSLLVELTVEF